MRFASRSSTWMIGPRSASSALSSQSVRSDGRRTWGAHETISPIDAVDRIVFRVSGVEEPQHALESPSRIRRDREFAPILLVSGRPVGRVDCEPRGHADGVGAALKCAHTRGKAPRLQPIVGADPAKERAARGLEHAPHVLVRTDVDLIDTQPDAPVGTRVFLEHPDRSVIRGVVADDEFEIGEVLRQDRFDAPLDDIPAVSYGEPDRKRWRVLTHRSSSGSIELAECRAPIASGRYPLPCCASGSRASHRIACFSMITLCFLP